MVDGNGTSVQYSISTEPVYYCVRYNYWTNMNFPRFVID
jgi:hypothetical protein